ncbi:MAG: hypothetical protein FWC60_05025, partial [Firmicutes bacterium]|nr:hypothetical protein [Bacillota bacterium]
ELDDPEGKNTVCPAGLQAAKDKFLFSVPGVARYYVTNGNSIIVEPAANAQEVNVRLFLLGTSFGALLMQRGILPLHGSVIVVNGGGVLFTGVSGAGKSTLLAAFRKLGYSFVTDDVAAITIDDDGVALVQPSYPQQKLWRDSAENIGENIAGLTPFYRGGHDDGERDKFAVPAKEGFCQTPVPLVALYEIMLAKQDGLSLKRLDAMDKLSIVLSHTYRPWLIDELGLKTEHFKQCVAVSGQIEAACLTRPEGVHCLEEQVALVRQDLARLSAGKDKAKL